MQFPYDKLGNSLVCMDLYLVGTQQFNGANMGHVIWDLRVLVGVNL